MLNGYREKKNSNNKKRVYGDYLSIVVGNTVVRLHIDAVYKDVKG